MTLSDSRQCRHLKATLRPLPSHRTGLPRLPEPPFRRAVPTTPADQAGARVDCFPARAAFPKWQEGRHPHCHFRGLLRLHSRYGPPDRSAALGDLCHEAPARAVTRTSRSSANRINRQLSGWNLPPLVIRAFGAHCHLRTTSTNVRSSLDVQLKWSGAQRVGLNQQEALLTACPEGPSRAASFRFITIPATPRTWQPTLNRVYATCGTETARACGRCVIGLDGRWLRPMPPRGRLKAGDRCANATLVRF